MKTVITLVLLLATLAIACASEPGENTFGDSADPQDRLVQPTLAEQSTTGIQTSPQETTQPKLAAQTITKAELQDGADLARKISLSLMPPEDLSAIAGYGFTARDLWYDWDYDPEDREFSRVLAEDGFGSEQEIRKSLFESGYLRRLVSELSATNVDGDCMVSKASIHQLITVILVFETEKGAEQFFTTVIANYQDSALGKGPEYLWAIKEVAKTCSKVRTDVPCCEYFQQTDVLISEVAFVVGGPFVIMLNENFVDFDPERDYSSLDYAWSQIYRLLDNLPEYFQ